MITGCVIGTVGVVDGGSVVEAGSLAVAGGVVEAGDLVVAGCVVEAGPGTVAAWAGWATTRDEWPLFPGTARATKADRAPALTMAPTARKRVARCIRSRPRSRSVRETTSPVFGSGP